MKPHVYKFKALTDLWTGDYRGRSERTIATGLLGSIRWWFEVLVRGLGGCACDPTRDGNRCPDSLRKPGEAKHHCAVCELFGCTSWARKFRFDVLDEGGQVKRDQIKKDESFQLRFTPLRSICDEEWALLDLTLRLIADYGAIGGKTVLKPSEEPGRENLPHHKDYGIVQIEEPPHIEHASAEALRGYLRDARWRQVDHKEFAWASLTSFWFVVRCKLARQSAVKSSFNRVLGRDQRKHCVDCGQVHSPRQKCPKTKKHPRRYSDREPSEPFGQWLAGSRQESKKVFSFKDPPRTFGFVKPDLLTLDDMRKRLRNAWSELTDDEFLEGGIILDQLLAKARGDAP